MYPQFVKVLFPLIRGSSLRQEGAVFFILTKLSEAKRNVYPIHGILKAVATGHNGSTRALATPNVHAQEAVCRKALAVSGISPSDVTILEGKVRSNILHFLC